MSELRFTDIQKLRTWALPAGIVILALAAALASHAGPGNSKGAVTDTSSTSTDILTKEYPVSGATPKITVNGFTVPTDAAGARDVAVPGGKVHVEVSDGHTRITTRTGGSGGGSSNTQSGNVDINVRSHTNGGTNWGSTQVYGFESSLDNSSSSFDSTSIFSSGTSDVNITK